MSRCAYGVIIKPSCTHVLLISHQINIDFYMLKMLQNLQFEQFCFPHCYPMYLFSLFFHALHIVQ